MQGKASYLFCILAALLAAPAVAQTEAPAAAQTQAEEEDPFSALNWKEGPREERLHLSKATAKLDADRLIVSGREAQKLLDVTGNLPDPRTEGGIYDLQTGALVFFDWNDVGYVDASDWTDVDPADLLESMKEDEEESNKERVAQGFEPFYIDAWIDPPTYDADRNVVFWAQRMRNEDGSLFVNALALKLGRRGYESLTWVGDVEDYQKNDPFFMATIDGLQFASGETYADYQEGDRIAEFTLGALVAGALGAKFGKGIIAVILAFFAGAGKKLLIVGGVALAGLALKFRNLFRR